MTTNNFNQARMESETLAMYDLDNTKYCVCIRYGVFGVFTLDYAIEKDYHIVTITL